MFIVSVLCCQVVVSATDRLLVWKSRTECGASEYDLETSAMRTPRPARAVDHEYTGCHRRNGPNFGRVFLMLNYTDITQNTYIQG